MIGIDISDRSIKVVEVTDDAQPALQTVCWSPLPPQLMEQGLVKDAARLAAELRAALKKCSPRPITDGMVVASIPESRSFMRVLDVPPVDEVETAEAVQWVVRRHIPFDLDRMYLDWEPVPGQQRVGGQHQVVVGAAQRDVVDPLLAVLDGLALSVVALELESQAVVRCLLPLDPEELQEIRGVLMVDMGATVTDIALFDRGAIRYTATVQWGGDDLTRRLVEELQVSQEEALVLKSGEGALREAQTPRVAAVIQAGILDLVNKVARAAEEMTTELPPDQHMRAMLLSGGNANVDGITGLFASLFPETPVHLGNPLANLATARRGLALSRTDAMHFTTAIGLALRPVDRLS
jgi:type IV pilus assembly protein PilM